MLFIFQRVSLATVTVTITQPGADPGTVMAGKAFTVTASGWSGSCTSAFLDLSECSVCSVSESQVKSISGSSISWTTLTATEAVGQKIKVSVSGTCSPDFGFETFDIKTPPSLSASVSPTSSSVIRGSSFSLSLNIQNNGETTARFGSVRVFPENFTISSGCSPSSITGGQSIGINCVISVSANSPLGSTPLTLTISPSNADSISKNIVVYVSSATTTKTTTTTLKPTTTVTAPTSSGGGENILNTGEINIPAGGRMTIKIADSNISSVSEITLEVFESVKNIKITVQKLPSKPDEVAENLVDRVYKYLRITTQNIPSSNIAFVKIKFNVERIWLESNGFDLQTVLLNRYAGGKWTSLQTSLFGKDGEYYYYEAESPGLSYFAITAKPRSTTETGSIPICGNGICEKGEDYVICSTDCHKPSQEPICGNKICETGENCGICLGDCPCASGYICVENICTPQEKKVTPKAGKFPLRIITILILIFVTIAVIIWLVHSLKEEDNDEYRYEYKHIPLEKELAEEEINQIPSVEESNKKGKKSKK